MLAQLRRVPFFKDFPQEELEEIGAQLQFKRIPQGEVVFAEGATGDALYLIESGQVRVVSGAASQRQALATLSAGDFFGEMALLTDEPRSAGVVASMDTGVWALRKADFDRLLQNHPTIAVALSRVLSRRLSEVNRQITAAPRPEIGERLLAVLGDQAPALARGLRRQTGERVLLFNCTPSASAVPWTDWLEAVHPAGGYDQLEASASQGPEDMARAIGALTEHYDRILMLVGSSRTPLALQAIALAEAVVPLNGDPPNWILDMADHRVWSLPPGAASLDRVARRIARRTVGIALSSGSAHGLAHIGVLQVLEEAGIPIDVIAGTSIGSLVGAIYATGKGIRSLLNFADESAMKLNVRSGLWDYAIPFRHGLIWGNQVVKYIRRLVDNATFESLATPLHIVAAELVSGREAVLNTGPVAEAVRASLSIPGLFVPYLHAGCYYVDGGAVNPVPCSVLAEHGANIIIAVNVTAEPEDRQRRGVRALGRGKGRGLPSIVEALMGSLELMEYEIAKTKSHPVSVLIQPKTGMYDSMAAEHAPELIRSGERAAHEQVGQIQALLAARRRPAEDGGVG
jgi:NTE family protein